MYYRLVEGKKVKKCTSCKQDFELGETGYSWCRKCTSNLSAAYRKRGYDNNSDIDKKRPWTKKEDNMVLSNEVTDLVLSFKIKRSVGAIVGRRCRLRKNGSQNNGN